MPTDKERLDWLKRTGAKLRGHGWGDFYFTVDPGSGQRIHADKSIRAAIDAAMRAERTRKKEKGR